MSDIALNVYVRPQVNIAGVYPGPMPVIEVPRKSDSRIDARVRDLSNDKAIFNLSEADFAFTVKPKRYTDQVTLNKDSSNGVDIVSAGSGRANIPLTADDLDLPPGDYWYFINIMVDDSNYAQAPGRFRALP